MKTEPESDMTFYEKFSKFLKYRGLVETLEVSLARLFLPIFILYRRNFTDNTFKFDGKSHEYYIHNYNVTWISERAVEIPIALDYLYDSLESGKKVLEVGNVLKHYKRDDSVWPIVDKYERGPDITNADIVDFYDGKKYDLVLSVSTMEHVGFDEDEKDDKKIERAIQHVKNKLLTKNGKFIFTFPMGYNPILDESVTNGYISKTYKVKYLKRTGKLKWVEAQMMDVKDTEYNGIFAGGSALAVVYV